MDLKKRLKLVVDKDKQLSPKYLNEVIKSDFYYLISNYFEVEFDDIDVEITADEGIYFVEISCQGERMKLVRTLPN